MRVTLKNVSHSHRLPEDVDFVCNVTVPEETLEVTGTV